MRVYLVGGAVRDGLLGRPVTERDWVIEGATPQALIDQGFRQVGRDFPVFLHPQTKEEYALARTERKTAPGHTGFVVHAASDVSLEEDLRRRDLTINALAIDGDGALVDPYGGLKDLRDRRLRHVSDAFAEDPLRVFRVARFAAQLAPWGFSLAPATLALMRDMGGRSLLAELSAERVYNEWIKALASPARHRFFEVLAQAESLDPWFAELRVHLDAINDLLRSTHMLSVPAAIIAIAWVINMPVPAWLERLKAPRLLIDSSVLLVRHRLDLLAQTDDAQTLLTTLEATDALRRGERFELLMNVLAQARKPVADRWLSIAQGLRAQRIDVEGRSGLEAQAFVRAQRLQWIRSWMSNGEPRHPAS